jgi:methylamine dehydrogenase light chain
MIDDQIERLARKLAQRTSRRGVLGLIGTALAGGLLFPLLPVNRVVRNAVAQDLNGGADGDPASCDYWRYCGFDGFLCGCCGGGVTECPAGTEASPTSWVGTCQHPVDSKEYVISYRDCCGRDACGLCLCSNDKGAMPIYRPQLDNDIMWCFGSPSRVVHCTTATRLGLKS